mmetsp:Transcript_32810/g.55328  ORF Transcript_32810/g.55328 Transcript_32810/m.55328 type:complete len:240 (+) Transcript_32810:31-750(+)|eukprot:CAMPEP_0174962980 /NCGR_PEP_ID=MMETSP0004_2-20121128/5070_1 /TAXON_ID=420556 /ORGANISM="Ochromonas sp., Strain CCMP1393" /LENGTH=239 /DNA_ID=CAMNT_0016211543 /DNA_START=31 /DNA_END=750 /DNA_ORIENTATION=+
MEFSSTLVVTVAVVLCIYEYSVYADANCDESDAKLAEARGYICASLVGNPGPDWCENNNTKADQDWPNQAVYMKNLLDLLVDPATCLNTSYANDTAEWLDGPINDPDVGGSWMWTYTVFQVQYYDMPRNEGDRIESPATLGRKCWAMAYNDQMWHPEELSKALTSNDLNANENFIAEYNEAIPLTMNLCYQVEENCFVNATYDASRNGTCPHDIRQFHLGFDRENLKRKDVVEYPFYYP